MLTRTACGLAIGLASVHGSLAASRVPAIADMQNVFNPSGADTAGPRSRSESAPTVGGRPYARQASKSRQ
jgi:hypothetical protein